MVSALTKDKQSANTPNVMAIRLIHRVYLERILADRSALFMVSFIEPPQADVIEEILKHCDLWESRSARAPPEVED